MKKNLLFGLIVVILFLGFISFRFGSALSQEKNPIQILTSIMKLEISNNGFQKVSENNYGEKYVSENNVECQYCIPKKFLEDYGWTYKEQMGSALIFEKNNREITIGTRLYSRYYYLWQVPKDALK